MKKIELLAPGGDVECIKAAIIAGADAVYCGLERFNARNRAANITLDDLRGVLRLGHQHGTQVFLTLNIIVVESELKALVGLLNNLVNTTLDGVIVQDLGMLYLLAEYFPSLNIHGSTQLTTHNAGQLQFLHRLHATRVNLSRELSLAEIQALTTVAHANDLLTEVFVHGSQCLGFSGHCYMSSVKNGNSGNRGRCSQPCRDQYHETPQGRLFPLNLKDSSAYGELQRLVDVGVDSLKIEGRIKKSHYVYTVVAAYRQQLQRIASQGQVAADNPALYTVFNRDLVHSFLLGDISGDMFIDNPRDHSAIHLAKQMGGCPDGNLHRAKQQLYDVKTEIINDVRAKIKPLTSDRLPLKIHISGEVGGRLKMMIATGESSFYVSSKKKLVPQSDPNVDSALSTKMFLQRFKGINDTDYYIAGLDIDHLEPNLFIPFKELTTIKKEILFILGGSRGIIPAIDVPVLPHVEDDCLPPTLSVLINRVADVSLVAVKGVDIYFEIPSQQDEGLVDLFLDHPHLIPWFPAILIGDDYEQALEFLNKVRPQRIVTNNSGIAYVAYQRGIAWIAGPYFNSVNSFSLVCLKEKFKCSGAFISSEINKNQIKKLKRPADFKLYYTIYQPILLLASRQCLMQQVTGCEKNRLEATCIGDCQRSATISSVQNGTFILHKEKGYYHTIYNDVNFLNTEIGTDSDLFAGFLVDIRRIKTKTTVGLDIASLVKLFSRHVAGDMAATEELEQGLSPVTSTQYVKGL